MRLSGILGIGLVVSGLAFGQGFGDLFEKAPPQVDAALRARINHFYQAHVDGKFREADKDVHEDSKDIFFAAEKIKYKSFKIISIKYEDNFTKARVVVEGVMDYYFMGVGSEEVFRPISSYWKLDNGEWWWYVLPYNREEGVESPFGQMRETSPESGQAPNSLIAQMEAAPKLKDIQSMVSVDRSTVQMMSDAASTEEVVIRSKFPGTVTLTLIAPELTGLSMKLDKDKLETGESCKLIITHKPVVLKVKKPDVQAQIQVQPTAQVIPIDIKFAYPKLDPPAPGTAPPANQP